MATTFSSREFNQDTGKAKNAARHGPVFITDRGKPSHVLLTIEEYHRLTSTESGIADLLFMPEAAEVEFDAPHSGDVSQPADLT